MKTKGRYKIKDLIRSKNQASTKDLGRSKNQASTKDRASTKGRISTKDRNRIQGRDKIKDLISIKDQPPIQGRDKIKDPISIKDQTSIQGRDRRTGRIRRLEARIKGLKWMEMECLFQPLRISPLPAKAPVRGGLTSRRCKAVWADLRIYGWITDKNSGCFQCSPAGIPYLDSGFKGHFHGVISEYP